MSSGRLSHWQNVYSENTENQDSLVPGNARYFVGPESVHPKFDSTLTTLFWLNRSRSSWLCKARSGIKRRSLKRGAEMLPSYLIIAGLFGAAGIALAAAAAHSAPSAGLDGAANILLVHALAILGGSALLLQGMLSRPLALIALAAWSLGTILFSADVALRAFVGQRLFPMAAPTGGIILILAWLVFAAAALAKAFDHAA
jgi:uncharacterized membrane protein YgdD (TMEM256/DUF423 family)